MYLVGTGGTAPYTNYAIFSGSLPTGLSLNATTGNITGTPTVSGSFPFVANVTDSAPSTAAGNCAIFVQDTSVAGAAPNCVGATVVPLYPIYGGVQHWQLSGMAALPTTGLGNLADVILFLNGPTGAVKPWVNLDILGIAAPSGGFLAGTCTVDNSVVTGKTVHSISPATLNSSCVGLTIQIRTSNYVVATYISASSCTVTTAPGNGTGLAIGPLLAWQTVDLGPNPPSNTTYTSLIFGCYNGSGLETASPFTVSSIVIVGWQGSTGGEAPNATINSVVIKYENGLTSNPGPYDESWQVIANATPPVSPLFQNAQGMLCNVAMVAVTASWSSSAPLTLYVKPWVPHSTWTCSVAADGVTVTSISPAVGAGAATVATNGYILIAGTVYGVASWGPASGTPLTSKIGRAHV